MRLKSCRLVQSSGKRKKKAAAESTQIQVAMVLVTVEDEPARCLCNRLQQEGTVMIDTGDAIAQEMLQILKRR